MGETPHTQTQSDNAACSPEVQNTCEAANTSNTLHQELRAFSTLGELLSIPRICVEVGRSLGYPEIPFTPN